MAKQQRSALEAPRVKAVNPRTKKLLKWGPLALSGLLVLGGGGALGFSMLGHEEDRVAVAELVTDREAQADTAEQSLEEALTVLLTDVAPQSPERISSDAAAGQEALGKSESIATFDAVLVSSLGSERTYAATFTTEDGKAGLFGYTTDKAGKISDESTVWADGAATESEPAAE